MKKVSESCCTAARMLVFLGFHAKNRKALFFSFVVDAALLVRTSHNLRKPALRLAWEQDVQGNDNWELLS